MLSHKEKINIAVQDLEIQLNRYKESILFSKEQNMVDLYRYKVDSISYSIELLRQSVEPGTIPDVAVVEKQS